MQVLGYGDRLGTVLVDTLSINEHSGCQDTAYTQAIAVKVSTHSKMKLWNQFF